MRSQNRKMYLDMLHAEELAACRMMNAYVTHKA